MATMVTYHRRPDGNIEWGEEIESGGPIGPWGTVTSEEHDRIEEAFEAAGLARFMPIRGLWMLVDAERGTGRCLMRRYGWDENPADLWDILPGGVARQVRAADYAIAIGTAAADHAPLGAVYAAVPDADPVQEG